MKVLRKYQEDAVCHLWEAFDKKEKVVLSAPTGAGKTALTARVFYQARERGLRVAFCIPFLSLVDQTFDALVSDGLEEDEISIIQADHPLSDLSKCIQICSVDTLVRRKQLPDCDLIIFDEVHRQSKLYKRWMKEAPNANFAGLSATPWAAGMADIWDRLIIVETIRGLIDQGYLSDYKYFAPASPDLSGVRIVRGDYDETALSMAMNKAELVADIISTWKKHGENRPTLCFAVSRAHAREIQSQFLEAGIEAAYCDAYTPSRERRELLNKLKTGEVKVLVNISTLAVGVDAPHVSCLILARPTKSEMLFLQIVGRGLRTDQGKENCLILDHSDTGLNLGLPCTIHYDELRDGKPTKQQKQALKEAKEKNNKPHKCTECNHLHDRNLMVCPNCGNVRKRYSDVVIRDGYLTELNRDGSQNASLNIDQDLRQDWYSGLLFIAMEKDYNHGWAAHKFKEKFGHWPDNLRKVAIAPSGTVRSWVRSRQIAYAKSKMRQNPKFQASVNKIMLPFIRSPSS